jgi:tellurium resistance protein TerZ
MLELKKGESLDLNKHSGKTLSKLRLGAGWDVASGKTIDLDLWLIPKGGKPVYFNHKSIPGATLDKDDLTGGSSADGADENIAIDVSRLENDEYTVVVNIYDAKSKGQFFKDVKRAFVEVEDVESKTLLFTYPISENGGDNFTLIAGKVTKKDGGLTFTADHAFSTKEMGTVVAECGGIA